MKKILLGLVLVLSIGCNNETPEQELAKLIEAYQNFQNDKDPDFPLGDYSETKFERRASFCDSLQSQLKKIKPNTFGEDDKISYALTSNGTNMNNNDISIAVLSAVFNKPYQIPVYTNYALTSEDLDKYLGVYATKQMPLKITVTKNKNTLIIQATGQQAFVVEATEKNKFSLDQVGAKFNFNPIEKTMVLLQGGGEIKFTKE